MAPLTNPYQDIINWLRSPAGEHWSETRIATAATDEGRPAPGMTRYANSSEWWLGGVFSVKEDYCGSWP